jgi:hypothetical protein
MSSHTSRQQTFREFVQESGLGFFSIGGDPQDLMSYQVISVMPWDVPTDCWPVDQIDHQAYIANYPDAVQTIRSGTQGKSISPLWLHTPTL